jgi:hypothetical protein
MAPAEFRPDAERLIGRVAHAEHPLIAADGAHASADLIGERLEGKALIGDGERAGGSVAGAVAGLGLEKGLNRLFEVALEEVLVTVKWDEWFGSSGRWCAVQAMRDVEPVDAVEEKERSHAFVQVGA